MMSSEHAKHIRTRVSYGGCDECRADTERRLVTSVIWKYGDTAKDYLAYVSPLLKLIRNGEDSVSSRIWLRKFRAAMHRRISLKVATVASRKRCDSYLERLRMASRGDVDYLKRFASRGASCLN